MPDLGLQSLTPKDMTLYADQMEKVKIRIDAAEAFFSSGASYPNVEAGLLQIRLAMETVALSTLVTNRPALEEVAQNFSAKKHDEAIKSVRRVNPDFWPSPSWQRLDEASGKVVEMVPIIEGYLTEEEYAGTWGGLSAWLHARNPFQLMKDPIEGVHLGISIIEKLRTLLNHHSVRLAGRDELLVCIMHEAVTGRVQVFGFGRAPQPPS